jgi:two-component system OmpR family sensor kinase
MKALHVRLTCAIAALLLVVGVGLLLLIWRTSERYAQEVRQRLDAGIAMYVVRELHLLENGTINQNALRELANRAMTVNPSAEVYLLDAQGHILSTVVQHERIRRTSVRLDPIRQFLSAPERRPLYGDDPASVAGRRVFSVAPIGQKDHVDGYLYVVLGGQPERSIAERLWGSYALRAASLALLLIVLATLAVSGGLFAVLTQRLRALDRSMARWMDQLPSGALRRQEASTTGDEIQALASRFVQMSQAIEQQIEELRSRDELRRELVANVSHDLRTPLASLRGYIETLSVKGSEISAEELRAYLKVALRQADQLGRLVDALFELARLESGTVAPKLEAFAIAELLQDIVLRFRVRAESHSIELHALLDTGGVTVIADIELIERAIGNLLENAIHHTPAGGRVRIEMAVEAALVRVRVVDTGEGIDPNHLSRIFDRYYRAQGATDQSHSGLGLSIVKRIMTLHAQSVAILSQKGVGTTVELTLQRVTDPIVTPFAKSA